MDYHCLDKTYNKYPLVIKTEWTDLSGNLRSTLWFKCCDTERSAGYNYVNLYLDSETMFVYGVGQEVTHDQLATRGLIPTRDIQVKLFCLWRLALLTKKLFPETRKF